MESFPDISLFNTEFCVFRAYYLTNDKILDWSKLRAFADNKIKSAKRMIFVFNRVDNIVRKGENAYFQHFLFFSQCSEKDFTQGH